MPAPRTLLAVVLLVHVSLTGGTIRGDERGPATARTEPAVDGASWNDLAFAEGDQETDPAVVSPPAPEAEAASPAPCACADPGCDCAKQKALAKQAAKAYRGVYYDNDFDYLCDPCYDDWHLGEGLKRLPLGCHTTLDVGGEYRLQFKNEANVQRKPLSGNSDDFLLQRTRVYLNAEIGDRVRFYGEAVDARSSGEEFPPSVIDVNRFDAINLFLDLKLADDIRGGGDLWARGGRQELLYGAQRLVSPLDWSNVRRTFDGAKFYYRNKQSKWSLDGWWSHPVPFGQHVAGGVDDRNFDRPARDQEFVGLWATYKLDPSRVSDSYFLRRADYSGTPTNSNTNIGDADFNMIGQRILGKRGKLLYEVEGGYQFGDFGPDDVEAGFFTVGLGRKLENVAWTPTLWVYYDWASGDSDPTDDTHGTFDQYFPLAHKYLGFMDIVGRKNIEDLNVRATFAPCDNLKLILWYHIFHLESATDALYGAGGAPIYQDPTGGSGRDIGEELDILVQWTLSPRADVWFGYSHFWTGDFFDSPVIQTAGIPPGGRATNGANGADADFFYTQFSVRF